MIKIGRNAPCLCGSGKKYKKCCLYRGIESPPAKTFDTTDNSEELLVKTLTDELFQPMRLYYELYNKEELIKCFQELKCIDYDAFLDDWTIQYEYEASRIGLKVSPKNVPAEAQPLIIATIYIEDEATMLIDVRSIERAAKIIKFIDKHVPKKIANIAYAAIYNKLITVVHQNNDEIRDIDYDEIFNKTKVVAVDPQEKLDEMETIKKQYGDRQSIAQAVMQKITEDAKQQLPEVEKFPVYYHEEGIQSFEMVCKFRQIIAIKHFLGNPNYSFYDLTQEFLSRQF